MGRIRTWTSSGRESLPESADDFLRALGGPTWISVAGRDRSRTRAVSTLLHGNEPSGFLALHSWLRSGRVPAVDALFLLAGVEAALTEPIWTHRQPAGARDLNRCFFSPFHDDGGRLACEALERLRAERPEVLVDIHNNTGHSPAYGVSQRVDPVHRQLVGLFGKRLIHSELRLGCLVEATADDFPSVVVECGRTGDPEADRIARQGLERLLSCEEIDAADGEGVSVLVDPVRVEIRPGIKLAFGERADPGADLTVAPDIDRHNFERLAPGVAIGWIGAREQWPVEARGDDGRDRSRELFEIRGGRLQTRRSVVPIMMTTHPDIARSDCLFYVVRPSNRD